MKDHYVFSQEIIAAKSAKPLPICINLLKTI